MAFVYNPGILGVQSPDSCGCQELLNKDGVVRCGWLRKKSLRNKVQKRLSMNLLKWPQLYVIIGRNCLYCFNSETSLKASEAVSLYGFNRIKRAEGDKAENNPWAFKLEHIQPSFKSLYFAASSEKEMIEWMKAIKAEMLEANNRSGSARKEKGISQGLDGASEKSSSSEGSAEYRELEGSIYCDAVTTEMSDSCNDDVTTSSYDEPVPALPKRPLEAKKAAEADGYSVQSFTLPGYTSTGDSNDYWKSVYFGGGRAEAANIINTIADPGVYLVRKSEDGSRVLVVYTRIGSSKYRIVENDIGQVTLSLNTGPFFDSLEELLYHFYNNILPNTEQKLTCPYKIHPDYSA